jgi:origin recognition complex subunit 4
MPPKRKTTFSVADDSPTKRHTRSSGVLLLDASLPRSSTPKKPTKTYGRKSRTSLITETSTDPRKEHEDVEDGTREESSEDELNLSPSRFPRPLASSPSSRKSMSSVVEVTIVTKRRVANRDGAGPSMSPATKQKRPAEKALRTSCTHLKSPVRTAEALFSPPLSSDKIPAMRINDDHVDPSEQDGSDSGNRPLLSVTKSAKFVPSTMLGFTPSPNLRKRRENPTEFSLQPSPKKKAATIPHTPELSLTTRQASPARIMGDSRSPSPTQGSAGSASAPASPSGDVMPLAASSPSKGRPSHKQTHPPQGLLPHLHPCLNGQKRAILRALHQRPVKGFWGDEDEESDDDEIATNEIAFQQLTEVLNGTVTRGEGNSCLLLGPRGSGKTTVRVSISRHPHSHISILSLSNNVYRIYQQSLI